MSFLTAALLGGPALGRLIARWGYGLVFAIVALQSLGAPLPGTTALIAAALYAGNTHRLQIAGVIAAGFTGALLGSVIAFTTGRGIGATILTRYGRRLGLDTERVRTGELLWSRYGGRIVFFGRFVTGLRNVVGFLAGTGRMTPVRFLALAGAAALVWALANGLGYYYFADLMREAGTAVEVALAAVLAVSLLVSGVLLRRRAGGIIDAARREAVAADQPPDDRPGAARR